jgi:hypothetical protein
MYCSSFGLTVRLPLLIWSHQNSRFEECALDSTIQQFFFSQISTHEERRIVQ